MGEDATPTQEAKDERAADPSALEIGEEPAPREQLSLAQAAELAQHSRWMRVGPLRFPGWTSTAVLVAVPVLLGAVAVAGEVAGERVALLTLTVSLFGLLLVIALWVDTGRSLWSVAWAVLMATALALIVGGALVSVATFSERNLSNNSRAKGRAPLRSLTQDEVDRANLVDDDLAGRDVSGLRFVRRDMERVHLDGATAVGAQFAGAWLKEGSMRGAVLTGAVLAGACLQKLDLGGAKLDGADFRGADTRGVTVDASQLSRTVNWPTPDEAAAATACLEADKPSR